VSHPSAIAAAEDKTAQLLVAAELGMQVPDTLITNSLEDAQAFATEHRDRLIYKPIRHTDYEIDGEPVTVWTKPVSAAELDDSIGMTMHLFQEKINKVTDWRITVIGDDVFTVQIDAPDGLLDWRYDYDALTYTAVDILDELTDQLHAYLKRFGLAFGCFDFGITADGEPVFFECNPNGQWAWLEPPTGLPMTAALADLLSKGTS
jgi:glutathione synthase/RimK-type ligase-like ATP-grasp enzyme